MEAPRALPLHGGSRRVGLWIFVHLWNTLVRRRKRGKVRCDFALIPVGDRIIVIRPAVGVPMLDGVLQRLLECHRIIRMPAIHAVAAAGALGKDDQRGAVKLISERHGSVASAEIPASQKVILRTCSGDYGP